MSIRSLRIPVCVTPEQKQIISDAAHNARMTTSSYMLLAAMKFDELWQWKMATQWIKTAGTDIQNGIGKQEDTDGH